MAPWQGYRLRDCDLHGRNDSQLPKDKAASRRSRTWLQTERLANHGSISLHADALNATHPRLHMQPRCQSLRFAIRIGGLVHRERECRPQGLAALGRTAHVSVGGIVDYHQNKINDKKTGGEQSNSDVPGQQHDVIPRGCCIVSHIRRRSNQRDRPYFSCKTF